MPSLMVMEEQCKDDYTRTIIVELLSNGEMYITGGNTGIQMRRKGKLHSYSAYEGWIAPLDTEEYQ